MRAKIEQWLICLLLAASYLEKVPGLLAQGGAGRLPLILGGIFYLGLIVGLARASKGVALFIAILGSTSAVLQVVAYLWIFPSMPGTTSPSLLQLAAGLAMALVAAFLGFDLWSQWHRAAKQAAAAGAS